MLEPTKFTEKQILGLIPAQALLDYDRAKEVLELVAQEVQKDTVRQILEWLENDNGYGWYHYGTDCGCAVARGLRHELALEDYAKENQR